MQKKIITALRVVTSLIFLWAFTDKLFGLGFATTAENAWLSGGSPTLGFLTYGTHGPLSALFQSLAGVAIIDWLFMLGLLFVGLSLLLKKFVKWGAIAGAVMMALIYLSAWPPVNNPLLDEHLIYILLFLLFYSESANHA
ncbi:MAG: hypothetical protein AAB690_01320 [Patescibacteria group bacterium]